MPGIVGGEAATDAPRRLQGHVLEEHLVEPLLGAWPRLGGALHTIVLLRLHPIGVREPVDLEVVVAGDVLVERGEHIVEPHGLVHRPQRERGDTPQRDRRHHTQRTEPDSRGREHLGALGRRALQHRAVTRDDLHRVDERRQRAELRSGAVRAGRQRARDGLVRDVAEVRERQAERVEGLVERAERHPRLHGDEPGARRPPTPPSRTGRARPACPSCMRCR